MKEHKPPNQRTARLFRNGRNPFDAPAHEFHGTVRAELERRGTPIGPNDLFISAHALALDLTLVTANASVFSRVPGLRAENWLD